MEGTTKVKNPTDCGVDLEQLQLIQLCFGEHEFGVVVDNDIESPKHVDDESSDATSLQIRDDLASAFDFDALLFVQEKLDHGVSLESLCRDLDTYTSYLSNAILRHVNTDVHDAFVKVSGHLVGMQDELRCVQQPVLAATKKVEAAMSRLSALEDSVSARIAEASDVELARFCDVSLLKLLLLHNLLDEQLDALPRPLRDESAAAPDPRKASAPRAGAVAAAVAGSRHTRAALRGIAATLLQLKAMGGALPQVENRAKEHEEAAALIAGGTQRAHRAFARAYLALHGDHEQAEALREVARVYQAADEVREFCRMYRENIMRPFLESVLSWRAATQARQNLEETIRLLVALRRELQEHVMPVLPLLYDAFDGALLPVPMIIWPTVCEALVKKMVSLYDAGIPDAFQQRYASAHDLLSLMEESCASAEELRALRNSPDVALWRHKWNTEVYSAMRSNELGRRVDDAMKQFTEAPFERIIAPLQQRDGHSRQEGAHAQQRDSQRFYLEPFSVLREGLEWLLSPGVYIYVATPKFLRESAIVSRRVAQGVASYCQTTQSTSALCDWLALVTAASADLITLAAYVSGPFRTHLEKVSGCAFPVSSTPLLQLILTEVCDAQAAEMRRAVQSRVAEECAAGLQNIRSVKSAYAHTKRPFPTAASWYVPSILEPLHSFEAAVSSVLSPSGRQEAVLAVSDEIATRFRAIAKETLLTAKKTEESWEKLRRRKETAGRPSELVIESETQQQPSVRPTLTTASDRDKMTFQLYLDAKAFIEEVEKKTGTKCESRPAFEALLRLLRRANWILGEDVPEPPDVDDESFS